MVKPEKFGHLHLVYHFTIPLKLLQEFYQTYFFNLSLKLQLEIAQISCLILLRISLNSSLTSSMNIDLFAFFSFAMITGGLFYDVLVVFFFNSIFKLEGIFSLFIPLPGNRLILMKLFIIKVIGETKNSETGFMKDAGISYMIISRSNNFYTLFNIFICNWLQLRRILFIVK